MTIVDYLETTLANQDCKERNFAEDLFGVALSGEVKKITDNMDESISFSGSSYFRLLSKAELEECENDMKVSFKALALIPILDAADNDYICYSIKEKAWCKFNIVDGVCFSKKDSILEYLI